MLFGGYEGCELELRAGGGGSRRLRGSFPYRKTAVLSDGGRNGGKPRKEQFAPGAFTYSLEITDSSPIHLLVGHSYDKPLASTDTGTLAFNDTARGADLRGGDRGRKLRTRPTARTSCR